MRAIWTLALTFAALAATAQASTVSTPGHAAIAEPGGIQILSNVVLPTILPTGGSLGSGVVGSQSARGNATLTIHGQTGDVLSMAVPTSFQVIRSGGTEGLTVRTTTDSNLQMSQGGVVLGGREFADGTMSVKVGGLVTIATGGNISPGPYEGLVVVLVQFN